MLVRKVHFQLLSLIILASKLDFFPIKGLFCSMKAKTNSSKTCFELGLYAVIKVCYCAPKLSLKNTFFKVFYNLNAFTIPHKTGLKYFMFFKWKGVLRSLYLSDRTSKSFSLRFLRGPLGVKAVFPDWWSPDAFIIAALSRDISLQMLPELRRYRLRNAPDVSGSILWSGQKLRSY